MGWNNIWGYVLVFLFLNSIIYSYADLNNNEDNILDISYEISLEEAFLKNLIKKIQKDDVSKDKFKEHAIFFIENTIQNTLNDSSKKEDLSQDTTGDENEYFLYEDNLYKDNIEEKEAMGVFKIIENEYIDRYVKFWSTPKKIQFIQESLNRGRIFIKEIKEIFKEEGLPEELAYLPIIESGFKNNAYSRAKAVGPWQFIPHTAKWMGMKMDIWIDERRDPVISARYAAKYLKFLYGIFNDWYLALAAYNHGGFNIKKSIKRANSKDYFDLIRLRAIPKETRSYVTSFISVLLILNSKENYNLEYEEEEINYDYVTLPFMAPAYLVAQHSDMNYKEFMELNPSLISGFVPEENYQYRIRLPKEKIEILNSNLEKLKKESCYSYIPYTVKEGDTLSMISQRYGISIFIIMKINNIKNPSYLRIGQRIYIPKLKQNS
ncbi:MAG TPA: transglycosylase SLT domain-containing protein [Spirochaetota bacterium]|nr:transglycosylase SLT domain-containing protein [Spirochaetota bacterium]HOL56701.1 transglycosylase SLT domain-containing protein [Spirochaetota bacterium]HPP04112.1 transglycosylase SLT domain-containing protein [Spirochaetota bacterium]